MPDNGADRGGQAPDRGQQPRDDVDPPPPIPTARRRPLLIAGGIFAALLCVVLVIGTLARLHAHQALRRTADDIAIPTVSVVHPKTPGGDTLVLPARLDAWTQASIYARVNGYLRHWYYDIGARVSAGTVLADIDTPEVDQQLAAATAALSTANAQRALAATTSTRFTRLAAQNAASQQDADQRRGDYAARLSERDEAQAEVGRLRALIAFKKLVAPFDGVVTARNTDIGALIAEGQANAPLFTVADLSRLRLYVSVPQNDVARIRAGLPAHFTVPDYPGRDFAAPIERTSRSVDPQSGAMLVQLVYDNAAGLLKPGGYAEVTIDLPAPPDAASLMRVPASSLLFRSGGTSVALAGRDGTVSLRKVAIIVDLGTELQVSGNLHPDDWIIDSPPDALGDGDKVRVRPEQPNRHA